MGQTRAAECNDAITCNDVIRHFRKESLFMGQTRAAECKNRSPGLGLAAPNQLEFC